MLSLRQEERDRGNSAPKEAGPAPEALEERANTRMMLGGVRTLPTTPADDPPTDLSKVRRVGKEANLAPSQTNAELSLS